MAANHDLDQLNGLFKNTYAKKIKHLVPDGVKVLKMIPFLPQEQQNGNIYNQPVTLGLSHGLTFAGPGEDAFTLAAAVASTMKNAEVRGNPKVLRDFLGYTSASRALRSGPNAFENATKYLVANMIRSIAKKLEIESLYGQSGYGVVNAIATNTITIETTDWAPGIWAGAQDMPIEIRDAAGTTSRGTANITSVDMDARTITVDTAPAGVVATDVIYHQGAFGKESAGLFKIITNTGTLFNIDASAYHLWKGNVLDVSTETVKKLSFARISQLIARGVEKGLEGKVTALVNPRGWDDLLNELVAKRQFDQSYSSKELEDGTERLVFHSQNGRVEVASSIYVKEGHCFVLAMDDMVRVGSSDVTFNQPGQEGTFFRNSENSAAYELRIWSDQAVFTPAPGHNGVITGIENSAP